MRRITKAEYRSWTCIRYPWVDKDKIELRCDECYGAVDAAIETGSGYLCPDCLRAAVALVEQKEA